MTSYPLDIKEKRRQHAEFYLELRIPDRYKFEWITYKAALTTYAGVENMAIYKSKSQNIYYFHINQPFTTKSIYTIDTDAGPQIIKPQKLIYKGETKLHPFYFIPDYYKFSFEESDNYITLDIIGDPYSKSPLKSKEDYLREFMKLPDYASKQSFIFDNRVEGLSQYLFGNSQSLSDLNELVLKEQSSLDNDLEEDDLREDPNKAATSNNFSKNNGQGYEVSNSEDDESSEEDGDLDDQEGEIQTDEQNYQEGNLSNEEDTQQKVDGDQDLDEESDSENEDYEEDEPTVEEIEANINSILLDLSIKSIPVSAEISENFNNNPILVKDCIDLENKSFKKIDIESSMLVMSIDKKNMNQGILAFTHLCLSPLLKFTTFQDIETFYNEVIFKDLLNAEIFYYGMCYLFAFPIKDSVIKPYFQNVREVLKDSMYIKQPFLQCMCLYTNLQKKPSKKTPYIYREFNELFNFIPDYANYENKDISKPAMDQCKKEMARIKAESTAKEKQSKT